MHGHGGDHGRAGEAGDGRRMRRGRVPALLLAALLDGPAHGYELMDRLEAFSGGNWRPSPGSVYPLLQAFEDRGLVRSVESPEAQGRRVFTLTETGREQAAARPESPAPASAPADPQHSQLRTELELLRTAARHVSAAATSERQVAEAAAIVRTARQALYRLLAD